MAGSRRLSFYRMAAQIWHMKRNVNECYKLQVTNLAEVCKQPGLAKLQIKRAHFEVLYCY